MIAELRLYKNRGKNKKIRPHIVASSCFYLLQDPQGKDVSFPSHKLFDVAFYDIMDISWAILQNLKFCATIDNVWVCPSHLW